MTSDLPTIYLASKSPRRREILSTLKLPFECISSPYEEKESDGDGLSPEDFASRLACLKAIAAAKSYSSGLIVGADTIVVQESAILGKPKDRADAKRILQSLSGRRHKVITGLAIVDAATQKSISHNEITYVYFKKLSEEDIELYLNTDEPYDKAGAYGIQGHAGLFVERVDGCYFNVVGFPVAAFAKLLGFMGQNINKYIASAK
jgi:septum formation protein